MTTSDVDTGTAVAAARSNGSSPERPSTARSVSSGVELAELAEAAGLGSGGRHGIVLDLPEELTPRERAMRVFSIFNYPLFEGVGSDDKYTFCPGHESSGMHEPSLHINFYGSMEQGDKNSLGDNFFSYCLVCQTSFYPNIMSGNIPECTAVEHPAGMDNRSNQAKAYARGSRMSSYQVHDEESYNKWCRQVARENSGYPYVVRSHEYALGEYVKEKWSDGVWVWLRRVSGGKYFKSLSGHQDNVPLYGADFLSPSGDGESREYVLAVEGEKDSDCARSLGFDSVSFHTIRPVKDDSPHLLPLDGRSVIVVADNDEAGLVRANRFAVSLAQRGINVQIVESLVGDDSSNDEEALKGFDLSDWVNAQGDSSGVVERLTGLLDRLAVRVDGSVHAGRVGSDGTDNVYGRTGQVLASVADSSGGSVGLGDDGPRVSEVRGGSEEGSELELELDESVIDNATKKFEQEVAKQQWRAKVLKEAKRRQAVDEFREPEDREVEYTLADALSEEFVEREFYIKDIFALGHNVTVVGKAKSGKTTLTGNLVRCLVDNLPFLGTIETAELHGGRIGMWNGEMEEVDYINYMRTMKISASGAKKISIAHLRGEKVNLLTDEGFDWTLRWLISREIEIWIPDPWSKICSWSNVKENDNDETKALQNAIDALKNQAGLKGIVIPTHPPRAEDGRDGTTPRTRGAAANDDWPDMLWAYYRDGEQRYLKVNGRGNGMEEAAVNFDYDTHLLFLPEGQVKSRNENRKIELEEKAMEIILNKDGINMSGIIELLGSNRQDVTQAVNELQRKNLVHSTKGERNSRCLHAGAEDVPSWPAMGV